MVNNAIRLILDGQSDIAVAELLSAISKADGYVHEDIAQKAKDVGDRVWSKRNSPT
jgi:hypothetical protein